MGALRGARAGRGTTENAKGVPARRQLVMNRPDLATRPSLGVAHKPHGSNGLCMAHLEWQWSASAPKPYSVRPSGPDPDPARQRQEDGVSKGVQLSAHATGGRLSASLSEVAIAGTVKSWLAFVVKVAADGTVALCISQLPAACVRVQKPANVFRLPELHDGDAHGMRAMGRPLLRTAYRAGAGFGGGPGLRRRRSAGAASDHRQRRASVG